MDKNLFKTLGDATKPKDTKFTFTVNEMEQCFKAGYDFAKDIFDNPSNSEYVNGIILQKEKKSS